MAIETIPPPRVPIAVDSTPPPPAPPAEKKNVFFSLTPVFGLSASTISNTTGEHGTLTWNTQVSSTLTINGDVYQFFGSFLLQFAELTGENMLPLPTQDLLMLTLRPSMQVTPAFKLFFDATAQTQVAEGIIDGQPTNVFDPIFIYESLCLGQANQSNTPDGSLHVDWTYGLGYALQETVTNNFILVPNRSFVFDPNDPNNLLRPVQSQLNFDKGFIGILDANVIDRLATDLFFNGHLTGYAVGKSDLFDAISNSRAAGSLRFGFHYKSFGIDYTGQILYDKNYSSRRQLQQSLVLDFRYQIQL